MVKDFSQSGHQFYPFDGHNKLDWLSKIDRELEKIGIERKDWKVSDEVAMSPFVDRKDQAQEYKPLRPYHPGWEIGASIPYKSGAENDGMANELLQGGAKALRFTDLDSGSKEYIQKLLLGEKLNGISTSFFPQSGTTTNFLSTVLEWFEDFDLDPEQLNISLPWRQIRSEMEAIGESVLPKISRFKYVIDVDPHEEDVVEELTHLLLSGDQALILIHKKGIAKDQGDLLQFSLRSDERILVNIAKIRALKITCQKILSVWGMPVSAPFIEVRLEESNDDVPANLVPLTSHALSSGIAGADRIIVDQHPNNKDLMTIPMLSLRMQQLLQLEGHLDWVEDPVAGSYFLENLTDRLAQAAWEKFQKRSTR